MEEEELSIILSNIKNRTFKVPVFYNTLFNLLKREKGKYIIQALLQAEADIVAQTSKSPTPEQTRLRNTHEVIVRLFANNIGKCTFYDDYKITVLHFASKYGWLDIVEALIKKGADLNAKEDSGYTPIMYATHRRHEDVVELFIDSGADIFCSSDRDYTLLHAASKNGWVDFALFLIKKGVDINGETNEGASPLDYAVKMSHLDVIALLLKHGANITQSTMARALLLRNPLKCTDLEMLQCLMESAEMNSFKLSPILSMACSLRRIEAVEYLVNLSNRITGRDDTPLNCVISRGSPNLYVVLIFIERGGYLDIYDYRRVLKESSLKEGLLQNIRICTQLIVNKFNNKDLPDLYKLPMSVECLPPIETFMIKSQEKIQDIEDSVRNAIEIKGHCNLLKTRPLLLSMMSVKSYIGYYKRLGKKSQPAAEPPFPDALQCPKCKKYYDILYLTHMIHDCNSSESYTGVRNTYFRSIEYLQNAKLRLQLRILTSLTNMLRD